MELHQYEKKTLRALTELKGDADYGAISVKTSLGKDAVMNAVGWLEQKGLVATKTQVFQTIALTTEGKAYLQKGFPEKELVHKASKAPVSADSLTQEERNVGIQWAKKKGWITIEDGKIFSTQKGNTEAGRYALPEWCQKIEDISGHGKLGSVSQEQKDLFKEIPQDTKQELKDRKLASIVQVHYITCEILKSGIEKSKELSEKGETAEKEINQLTREMLISGEWKGKHLRQYNIDAPVEDALPGKRHIISALDGKISRIFLEMGFEEMKGGMIESSFWNFDALFQPQDHPARDLADTFYLEGDFPLPDPALVSRVKKSHERGWKCKWRESEAKRTEKAWQDYRKGKFNSMPKEEFLKEMVNGTNSA